MTLTDVGQTLKKERKRQQLSLEDVYATTKIGMDILRAIEEADLDQLPHMVYARGFVRNYAQFLGLSGEEMVQAFDRALQEERTSHPEREGRLGDRPPSHGASGKEGARTKRSVALLLLLLLILAGLVYYFFVGPPQVGTKKDNSSSVADNATLDQKAHETSVKEGANASTSEDMASRAGSAPREAASHRSASRDGAPEQASAAVSSSTGAEGTVSGEESNGSNSTSAANTTERLPLHELRIVAAEACWINVETGDTVSDFYLEPGQQRTIRFRGSGSFLLGNAGGVTLYLDGAERSFQAESGEVREIILP